MEYWLLTDVWLNPLYVDGFDMSLERVDIIHSFRHYAGRLYQVARAFPCRCRSSALTNSRSLSLRVF